MDLTTLRAVPHPRVPATERNQVRTPVPLPAQLPAAAQGTFVPELPAASWDRRSVARFHYANDDSAPHGADDYPYSPLWTMWESQPPGMPGRGNRRGYGYVAAGTDFMAAVALAAARTRAARDEFGWPDRGAQAVLQARDGVYYLADLHGWADEIPFAPGMPGGPQAPYSIDQMVEEVSGRRSYRVDVRQVERHTPALKAVVDQFHWVDFTRPQQAAS